MRKYNPALKGMVDNYRKKLEGLFKSCTLNYTDLELYAVIDYWAEMSTSEEQFECVQSDVNSSVRR